MRKIILTVGIAVGVLILIVGAVLFYAVANLNSIIASQQKMLLDKLGDAVGRPVEIEEIKASLGWGVSIAVSGLKIADDPAFSQLPFVAANQVSGAVELLPLLGGDLKVTRLVLDQPQIRVLRDAQGQLNVSTIGRSKEKAAPAAPAPQANIASENKAGGALNALSIENFSLAGGNVYYSDAQDKGAAIEIKRLDLDVSDFSANAPFGVKLKLAALGDQQNFSIAGKAGPILSDGSIDPGKLPLDLKIEVGPLLLDKLRGVAPIGPKIPAKLSMPDPVSIDGALRGSLDDLLFEFASDLSAARVVYIGLFNKPAGTLLKAGGSGARRGGELAIAKANVNLADLDLSATKVVLGNPMSAQIDTNRFDLATLGPMIAAMAKYNASGKAEIHAAAQVDDGKPSIDGTIALAGVALKPEGTKLPGITDLSGKISMAQNGAVVEPTNFMIGSGHANLEARAESIDPLRATYSFKADSLKLAEFVAGRPPGAGEAINQLSVAGSADGEIASPSISAKVMSANGKVLNVAYQNLAMNASYTGKTAGVKSLNVQTFAGTLAGDADAVLGDPLQFHAAITTDRIDLQQALAAQESSAANIVRGLLTSQVNLSGRGSTFDQMKPTFSGAGKIAVADGKLVGVNVVAEALNKVNGLPQIGSLVSPSLFARHPELFKNPDTDLKTLAMTFQMTGPRITSHDILAATQDYRIVGDGWFDLDKQLDLSAKLVMSKEISAEIVAEKKNVVYVTNQNGEIDIPLLIRGRLPKPSVTPDVNSLVQRAASHAIEREGSKAINKFLEKKGLGGLLGGSSPASPGSGPPQPAPSNPLAPLKNLFR
ncbi:MAG TPA: AsmA family protein [Candidatus Binataceae bacterium]